MHPRIALLVLLCLGSLRSSAAPIDTLTFTPDSKAVVYNRHGALQIRSVTGPRTTKIPCDLPKITDAAFSPDKKWLAVTGGLPGSSGGLRIYEWSTRKLVSTRDDHTDTATSVAFHPKSESIAVASADRTVLIFELADGKTSPKPIGTLTDHSRPVLDLAFSPDGKTIVTGSADRSLKVWDAATGRLLRSLGNHTEIVHCLAMRPPVFFAGRQLPAYCASASDDRTVRVWQPGIGRMVRIIRYHEGPVFTLAWHPTGDRLFSAGKEGIIRMIDGDSDEVLGHWPAHKDWTYSLATSADGKLLASGDWAGVLKLWEIRSDGLKPLRTWK
jgi:WD40 repeat protein